MTRMFLQPHDIRSFVTSATGRRLTAMGRLTGGTKKGVYRLTLDDASTVVLYVWAAGENFWPEAPAVADDPFTDADGADLFATNHAALTAAGVRVPRLLVLDRDRRHLDADLALVEDAGSVPLDSVKDPDPALLAGLGDALRRMHTTTGPRYGKLALIASGAAPQTRRTEEIVADRALGHLAAAAGRDHRLADAHDRIAAHIRDLTAAVTPRRTYGLVHGELGPDHVLVTPLGETVMIDFEGLTYFDVEWDHAWLQLRFGPDYPALRPVELDADRLALYRYAQTLSLVEGPLRIAGTDFPGREWMLALAERNIAKALAAVTA